MIQAHKLAKDWRCDPKRTLEDITECLRLGREGENGGLQADEFSIRDLAAQFIMEDDKPIGLEGVERLYNPKGAPEDISEATSGVHSSAFANITGQIVFSRILQGYMSEDFVVSRMVSTIPTRLKGEKIPGINKISDPGQDALVTEEGEEYATYGFGENYIETPVTAKRGLIVPVTKEAIFYDRTNLVLSRAGQVGEILGTNKEKRLLDMVIGGAKTYKRNGTEYWTYYSAADTGAPYINHLDNNALVDWTDIDNLETLFAKLTDPDTGEPIIMTGRQLLIGPQLRMTANRILTATNTRTGTDPVVESANPLATMGITTAVSRLLYARMIATDTYGHSESAANAKGYYWYGDFKKAFAYMQNWALTTSRAPTNSEAEFSQDIVARFKASEMGAAAVLEPRAIIRSRAVSGSSSSSGA